MRPPMEFLLESGQKEFIVVIVMSLCRFSSGSSLTYTTKQTCIHSKILKAS
jgi:hypothetical protein